VLIVDTGVLLAAADRNDPDHDACAQLLENHDGELVTTPLVVAETGYLIARQLGASAEVQFYRLVAVGEISMEILSREDLVRIADLVATYSDLPLGGTDASLVAIAERHRETTLATLDRRHFSVVASNFSLELRVRARRCWRRQATPLS